MKTQVGSKKVAVGFLAINGKGVRYRICHFCQCICCQIHLKNNSISQYQFQKDNCSFVDSLHML